MDPLEIKRVKADLLRTQAAKAELEVKIEERLADIERIKDHIVLQEKREKELSAKLSELTKAQG